MKAAKASLGDLERDVMRLVWKHGPITADALRERLDRPLKDSTVRTVLRRLEEKQFLTHTVDNRTFIYSASEARERMAVKAVKRLVDWFDGTVEDVIVGMVDESALTEKQLDALAKRIDEARRAKSKSARKGERS